MRKIIGIIIFAVAIYSCGNKGNDTLLAEACGKKLYLNDLADFFPANDNVIDTTAISAYTTAWVQRQLMIKKADDLLDEKQKNLTTEIEDYRSSLLIYRLEQDYISKNVDTLVTPQEIENFYNENRNLFVLQSSLVKVAYIKIQTAAPETDNIKKMCRVPNRENMKQIEDLCMQYAEKYDLFNGRWVDIYEILRLLPPSINSTEPEKALQTSNFYETKDALYSYFIILLSELPKGSISPLERERENIRTLITNKRKRDLISNFEEDTYNDGISNKDAKIYINNKKQ